jgi:hypothetical protein
LGEHVKSKIGDVSGIVIDAWTEGDMPEGERINFVAGAETFYKILTHDGQEFIERFAQLESAKKWSRTLLS